MPRIALPVPYGCNMTGINAKGVSALLERARREVDSGLLPAAQLALALEGEIVVSEALGDCTTGTRFHTYSAVKPSVALAAMELAADGLFDVAAPVRDVLEPFGDNGKEAVTVSQVMLHAGGFPYAPLGRTEATDRAARMAAYASWETDWAPGTRFEYHALSAHWVLADIVTEVTGRPYADVIAERVMAPAGCSRWLGIGIDDQAGVADVVAAFAILLAVGPVFVAPGDLAVFVHGHPNGRAVGARRPEDAGGEVLQADGVALGFLHGGSDVDGLGHGRVEVRVGVAVLVHPVAPALDDLGRLAEDVGGPTGDDLDLAAGGEVDAGRAGADGLEQGRIGLLHGLGEHPEVIDVGVLAVVGEAFLGPCLDDDIDGFLEPFAAGVDVDAHAVELLLLITSADAEVDASVADHIQHGHFLGHQDGIVQGQDDDRSADADVFGASGDGAEERPDAAEQAVAGETVLAQPRLIKAGFVGEGNLLQSVVEGLGRREVFMVGNDGEDSELHGGLLWVIA